MEKISQTDTTQVRAVDEPDNDIGGGACHLYDIILNDGNTPNKHIEIPFQKGAVGEAVGEAGVNGIRDVDLMQILRHRLIAFQNGEYKCEENEKMLYHICAALNWESKRTKNREKRGVEGTSQK